VRQAWLRSRPDRSELASTPQPPPQLRADAHADFNLKVEAMRELLRAEFHQREAAQQAAHEADLAALHAQLRHAISQLAPDAHGRTAAVVAQPQPAATAPDGVGANALREQVAALLHVAQARAAGEDAQRRALEAESARAAAERAQAQLMAERQRVDGECAQLGAENRTLRDSLARLEAELSHADRERESMARAQQQAAAHPIPAASPSPPVSAAETAAAETARAAAGEEIRAANAANALLAREHDAARAQWSEERARLEERAARLQAQLEHERVVGAKLQVRACARHAARCPVRRVAALYR
jgi:hypothetical protein